MGSYIRPLLFGWQHFILYEKHCFCIPEKELWNRIHYEIDNTLEEHYDGCYDDGYKEIDVLSQQY